MARGTLRLGNPLAMAGVPAAAHGAAHAVARRQRLLPGPAGVCGRARCCALRGAAARHMCHVMHVTYLFSDEGRQLMCYCVAVSHQRSSGTCGIACANDACPGMADGHTEPSSTLLIRECVGLAVLSTADVGCGAAWAAVAADMQHPCSQPGACVAAPSQTFQRCAGDGHPGAVWAAVAADGQHPGA